ncbi:MAG TPA: response regulator [Vicinamibacteria bacterium]|nr:response regulator [Vicinamibacteria bacterium]
MSLAPTKQPAAPWLLVVEDQADFAALIAVMLSVADPKWDIDRRERLDEALARLAEGGIEAVLLDLRLPDASGLHAVDAVVGSFPDVAVVVMTSYDRTMAVEALQRGAQDYLIKGDINAALLSRSLSYAVSRKRAELAQRRSDARFRAAVEGSLDAVGILSAVRGDAGDVADFVVTDVNRNAERLLGRRRDEVVSRRLSDLWPLPSLQPFIERAAAVMRAHAPLEEELRIAFPAGSGRWIHHQIVPLDDGVAIAVRDTTARQEAEADLHRREEQVRQSQKMEAIGRLAGGVAHDFNNLLTVIRGHGELVLRKLTGDHPMRRNLLEIGLASERAAALTHQLLAFSRKQVLQPRILDLGEVVERMSTLLQRLIGEDVELVTRRRGDLGSVRADPAQMEQVIINLAVNARDAMPRGGQLTLELANVELDETFAHSHAGMTPGPYVVFSVTDTGHGMDEDTKARIFEPFFTTKEAGKGTGLGLPTVYGIVKQSGGFIWVYSEPGHGTTFKIHLPRVDQAPERLSPRPGQAAAGQGTETVLLVEDEDALRALLREVLESLGYRVLEAGLGAEALRIAREHRGPIHVLLTDLVMPQMTGRELADRLSCLRPDLKVLFMSGYGVGAAPRQEIPPDGAYIEKPFTADAMGGAIRALLDSLPSSAS